MILLNSIWLFALAALSIPVAIHLWNIRKGKTLKVGSIALINESSPQSSRSVKLNDLLLLLLRCLLLALLVFVLTMPFWQRQNSTTVKGWVLIPKENIKESYQKFRPEIDSLIKAGYEFHYFDKDFQKDDLNKILANYKDSKPVSDDTNIPSYWTLAQRLDGQIPVSLPVYLFTSNQITHFNDEKPRLSLNLHWKTYAPADSISTWIENAWLTNNNDVEVVQGNSKPSATYYTDYTIRSGSERNTPFAIKTDNGRMIVSLKNSGQSVNVDTSTWRFAIYAEKNAADAGYVKAALESIIQFTKHKAVIEQYANSGQIPTHQNWVFWLSQKPAGKRQIQNCDNLFTYEAGKVKDISSWINDQNESLSRQKIAVYKSVVASNDYGFNIWYDGFGNPILSYARQRQTSIYHFYGRFDPSWSDLVWSDDFPKMLLKLIVNQPADTNTKHDRRTIDIKQLLPTVNNEAHTSAGKIVERTNLTHYCWLLLALVFMAERWLAHKKAGKQILQNG